MKILLVYIICINIFAFLLFAVDKRRSRKRQWRIREWTLLFSAFIGGSMGAFLSMQIFRHKTKHNKFRIGVPIILLLHIFLLFQCIIRWPEFFGL